jgi:dsDNA-specific endonuclease/ATPase MutS2
MPRFRVRKADSMDTAAEVLQLAQQAAEQAIADAQREAEEIRARARQEAEQIIADAKARAERLLGPWTRHSVMPRTGSFCIAVALASSSVCTPHGTRHS